MKLIKHTVFIYSQNQFYCEIYSIYNILSDLVKFYHFLYLKGDQLELTNQTLKAELERLGRSLDSAHRREEELEVELKESGLEIESLGKRQDEAMLEVARLEQEKEGCQSELDSQRREQRQKEREMARLRQQLESTASALEHGNQRACSLELQNRFRP